MRNPRSRKTEGKKYAAAENRIIQSMKNFVTRSVSEVKALFVEFNFICYRQGCRGSDYREVLSLRLNSDCYF